MSKYKVGDEVLIKAKVVEIDVEDTSMPYNLEVKNDSFWVEIDEIIDMESSCDDVKKAYDQGLNDAWELSKRIIGILDKENHELMPARELIKIYGSNDLLDIFAFTPQEALAKLKAYEEVQKVKLGEIVIVNIPDEKGIVIVECQDGEYKVLMEDFDIVKLPASKLTKIGRFVALNNILEQIGE